MATDSNSLLSELFVLGIAGALVLTFLVLVVISPPRPMHPESDVGSDIRTLIKKGTYDGYASPQSNFKVTIAVGTAIAPANVVNNTDLSQDQVCISTGDFKEDPLFVTKDNGAILYTGSSNQKIGISVLCGRGADLTDNLVYVSPNAKSYDTSKCSGWAACNEPTSGTCCLVALRRV